MKNQFIFTYISDETELKGSFNIEKVIRTASQLNGELIVLLDDFNERVFQEPDINPKTGKQVGVKNVRQTVQSEFRLSPPDAERFFKITNIEL